MSTSEHNHIFFCIQMLIIVMSNLEMDVLDNWSEQWFEVPPGIPTACRGSQPSTYGREVGSGQFSVRRWWFAAISPTPVGWCPQQWCPAVVSSLGRSSSWWGHWHNHSKDKNVFMSFMEIIYKMSHIECYWESWELDGGEIRRLH